MIKNLVKADLKMTISSKWWMLTSVFLFFFFMIASHTEKFEIYLQWAYLPLPLFLLPLVSSSITEERESKFLNSVFTTPITKEEYIASKFLFWIIIGFIYLLFTLPVSFVHYYFIGGIFLLALLRYIFASILIICFISGLGILISLLCVRETKVSLSIGFLFALVFYVMYTQFPRVAWNPSVLSVVIYHISPIVSAGDFLNAWWHIASPLQYHMIPLHPLLSVVSLIVFSAFLVFSSYLVFKKLQDVESFDFKQKFAIVLIAMLLIVPPLLGNSSYTVGEKELLGVSSLNISFESIPRTLIYNEEPMNVEWIIRPMPHELTELHNVSITLKSEDLRFIPDKLEFPAIELKNMEGKKCFDFQTKIDPIHIKGAVSGSYRYEVDIVSDELNGYINTCRSIENKHATEAVNLTSLITAVLFLGLSICMRKRLKLKIM